MILLKITIYNSFNNVPIITLPSSCSNSPSSINRNTFKNLFNILSFLNLEKQTNSLARTFSGGMIRKLEIGQSMVHHPQILFLDEPTTGLDPVTAMQINELINKTKKELKCTSSKMAAYLKKRVERVEKKEKETQSHISLADNWINVGCAAELFLMGAATYDYFKNS